MRLAHQVGRQLGGYALAFERFVPCIPFGLPGRRRGVSPEKRKREGRKIGLPRAIERDRRQLGMLADGCAQRFIDYLDARPDMDGVENLHHIA